MKRALAERAKQQTDEQFQHRAGVSMPVDVSMSNMEETVVGVQDAKPITRSPESSDAQMPPKKIPRTESQQPVQVSSSSSTPNKKVKKRIRPPSILSSPTVNSSNLVTSSKKLSTTEDADETSAFYLKHQNKALASELHQFKFTIHLLSQERDKRREECRTIAKALSEIKLVWEDLENKMENGLNEILNDQKVINNFRI